MCNGHADRPSPDFAVIDDKARDEVFVFAGRLAVFEADANDLVTGALRPVPGAMLGRESVATVFRRETAALIEGQAERGRMRLQQHVRHGDLVLDTSARAAQP